MIDFWLMSYVVLWILVLVMAILLIGVLRYLGILFQRYDRLAGRNPPPTTLKTGQLLPDLTLRMNGREPVTISSLRGKSTAILVVRPGCSPCKALLREVSQGGSFAADGAERIVVVSMSSVVSTLEMVDGISLPDSVKLLVDENGQVENRWGVVATPVSVIVDADLKVVKQIIGLPSSEDNFIKRSTSMSSPVAISEG